MYIEFLLIQRMKHGDEAAFHVFIHTYYEEILKYCSYHCSDISYAEDLTQETFLRFFEKLSDYRYMGKNRNYLYTIAGNLCKDYYKKEKADLMEELYAEEQINLQKTETENVLDKVTIQAALDDLPEELREVIILYYFQELKLAEISRMLGIGLPLVKYRVKQAKIRLKELLGEE